MKVFYRKSPEITKREYYVTLDLLNTQAVFDNVFGKNLHMFAAQPNNLNKTKNK